MVRASYASFSKLPREAFSAKFSKASSFEQKRLYPRLVSRRLILLNSMSNLTGSFNYYTWKLLTDLRFSVIYKHRKIAKIIVRISST